MRKIFWCWQRAAVKPPHDLCDFADSFGPFARLDKRRERLLNLSFSYFDLIAVKFWFARYFSHNRSSS